MALIHTVPNSSSDLTDPASALYSVDYAVRVVYMGFLKTITEEGICPEQVLSSMHILLLKAEKDLEEKIGTDDHGSTGYAMWLCVNTVKDYVRKYLPIEAE